MVVSGSVSGMASSSGFIVRNGFGRMLLFSRYLSHFKFLSSSSSSSSSELQFLRCSNEDCGDFLPWLERKAGREISTVLSIGKSPYGRSLFVTKSVQPGDCLLKIPYNVQIAPDTLIPEISSLLSDEAGSVARLAVVILTEQRKGQHSEWAPYISCLPEVGKLHNTIFWSKTELEMIRQSSVYRETIEKNVQIERAFLAVKSALDRFSETFAGITFESFQHAYALVESRAWRSTRGVSLIPFADFLNHDGLSETAVLSDESTELSEVRLASIEAYSRCLLECNKILVIADCVYVPGDQVLISYGKFSNSVLLLDFGFTLSHNIYDEVKIRVNMPHGDPLRMEKLILLHRHRTPVTEEGCRFCYSVDVFTIKEVRSIKGKGRGIPQALRAYCRVLCSTSSQELVHMANEAIDNDGRLARYPLKNKSREIEAHRFLLSWIAQLIGEYNESVELLEASSSPCMIEQHNRRRKMALDLLTGELRVLKSAAEWLKHYCAELS